MTTSIQERVVQATKHYFDLAAKLYGVTFDYEILFNLRGTTAGQACYSRMYGGSELTNIRLRYNNVLMAENTEDFIDQTVPHEVAHIVAQRIFGSYTNKVCHGTGWKRVMEAFGKRATRCHDYDVSNARVRNVTRIEVTCGCRTHQVSKKVATKIQMGYGYRCKVCRSTLTVNATQPVVAKPVKKPVTTAPATRVVVKRDVPATPVVKKAVKVVTGKKVSALDQAKEIYMQNINSGRQAIIKAMVDAGIKAGTAGAYYNKFANHNG